MVTYTLFPIEREPHVSPAQLAAYKSLRLASLQVDPQAFFSTYAREVTFSDDFWRHRLESPFQRTFVASVLEDCSHGRRDVNEEAVEGEWVGMASIVGPSDMPPTILALFDSVGANWGIYGLFAMWVHPAHRGKGVGARLVNACLEWARTNVDSKFSGENSGDFEKVVILLVYENNVAGRKMYSRAGFTDLEGVPSTEGERWMVAKV